MHQCQELIGHAQLFLQLDATLHSLVNKAVQLEANFGVVSAAPARLECIDNPEKLTPWPSE